VHHSPSTTSRFCYLTTKWHRRASNGPLEIPAISPPRKQKRFHEPRLCRSGSTTSTSSSADSDKNALADFENDHSFGRSSDSARAAEDNFEGMETTTADGLGFGVSETDDNILRALTTFGAKAADVEKVSPLEDFHREIQTACEALRADRTKSIVLEPRYVHVNWVHSYLELDGSPLRGYISITADTKVEIAKDARDGRYRRVIFIGQVYDYPASGAGVLYGIDDDTLYLEVDESSWLSFSGKEPAIVSRWIRFGDLLAKGADGFDDYWQ
jgi:hypothetical protein